MEATGEARVPPGEHVVSPARDGLPLTVRDGLLFTLGYVHGRDPATAVERVLDLCVRAAATDPPGGYDGHATVTVDAVLHAVASRPPRCPRCEHVVSTDRAWWLCPNDPPCAHGSVLHDIWDYDDESPMCCVDGCDCGKGAPPRLSSGRNWDMSKPATPPAGTS